MGITNRVDNCVIYTRLLAVVMTGNIYFIKIVTTILRNMQRRKYTKKNCADFKVLYSYNVSLLCNRKTNKIILSN